jgi:EAL domain-containing protein (putative c-di-GMP-specific phosphodiesterase class I)
MVNTKQVARRPLRFTSIDAVLAEAERLAAAERDGRLKPLGNWTLGQALHHLAVWITFAYEGFPSDVRPPAALRFLLRLIRRKILNGSMPAGVRLPKVEGGTHGTEKVTTVEGLAQLRRALNRLRTEPARHASPAFGKLTAEEWEKLNLRHAELHLGFFEG